MFLMQLGCGGLGRPPGALTWGADLTQAQASRADSPSWRMGVAGGKGRAVAAQGLFATAR